jgi:methionyl-tRNA synthetase
VPSKNFYITTTLPYVNADPHLGFALEIVQTDVLARYHEHILKDQVFFNTGTDEHGLKIYRQAKADQKGPQTYVDEYAARFDRLKQALNLSYNSFIRTTDPDHIKAAQEFWRRCEKNGDIDKKIYQAKYCVGCELEKTDSELVDGRCPLHPNRDLEIIEEDNYFFKFSNYQEKLLNLYDQNPQFVLPQYRLKEIKNFVQAGLQDFSISRLKSKMPWGVPVPGDDDHVMYVWFDALVSYISALGWPKNQAKFEQYWPGIQTAGKDNLRQQSAMWQAMLISAGLLPSKQIFIHGFITADGKKMSKSVGNVVDPFDLVEKYGTDAVRHFLLAELHPYEDNDFTIQRFKISYNASLVNGLGNTARRLATMAQKSNQSYPVLFKPNNSLLEDDLSLFNFQGAMDSIWNILRKINRSINNQKVWELKGQEQQQVLAKLINLFREVIYYLQPFLPQTAETLSKQFNQEKIKPLPQPLFPKLK